MSPPCLLTRHEVETLLDTDLLPRRVAAALADLSRVPSCFGRRRLHDAAEVFRGRVLTERRRIAAALDELPPDVTHGPSDEAIALATQVGALWPEMTPTEKRRFIDQWFHEIHIGRRAESLEVVPSDRTKGPVYAACTSASSPTVPMRFIQRG